MRKLQEGLQRRFLHRLSLKTVAGRIIDRKMGEAGTTEEMKGGAAGCEISIKSASKKKKNNLRGKKDPCPTCRGSVGFLQKNSQQEDKGCAMFRKRYQWGGREKTTGASRNQDKSARRPAFKYRGHSRRRETSLRCMRA